MQITVIDMKGSALQGIDGYQNAYFVLRKPETASITLLTSTPINKEFSFHAPFTFRHFMFVFSTYIIDKSSNIYWMQTTKKN